MIESILELFTVAALAAAAVLIAILLTRECQAAEPTPQIKHLVAAACAKYGVEYDFAMAVIQVESNFNPLTTGAEGEVGLFQLHPKWHPKTAVYEIKANIDAGVHYLADVRASCIRDLGPAWVVCYNRGPNYGPKTRDQTKYYDRVITVYLERMRQRQPQIQAAPYVEGN